MDLEFISKNIKSSFCNLTQFKLRGEVLEVITAFSTINRKFISVFVTFNKNEFVITDNGWVYKNYYENSQDKSNDELLNNITNSYINSFNVKQTVDVNGIHYYYKKCDNISQIPAAVFDVANFLLGIINATLLQYKDESEEKERDHFKSDASSFLKSNYKEAVSLKKSLDDIKSVVFNAIIEKESKLYLITYITGSSAFYFDSDINKSIVNFELSKKSNFNPYIKGRYAIINDLSLGYNPQRSSTILGLLYEKTNSDPILWSKKETLLSSIN